jgi:hypothetical protein
MRSVSCRRRLVLPRNYFYHISFCSLPTCIRFSQAFFSLVPFPHLFLLWYVSCFFVPSLFPHPSILPFLISSYFLTFSIPLFLFLSILPLVFLSPCLMPPSLLPSGWTPVRRLHGDSEVTCPAIPCQSSHRTFLSTSGITRIDHSCHIPLRLPFVYSQV